jgi:hypothetical protein
VVPGKYEGCMPYNKGDKARRPDKIYNDEKAISNNVDGFYITT